MKRLLAAILLCVSIAGARAASAGDDLFKDYPTPDAAGVSLDYSKAWPARWRHGAAGVQGGVIDIPGPSFKPGGGRIGFVYPPLDSEKVAFAGKLAAALGATGGVSILMEEPGSFTMRFEPVPEGARVKRSQHHDAAMDFVFVSARPEAKGAPGAIAVERTWFSYFEPLGEGSGPKGVVLLMPGLFATPMGTLDSLTRELRVHGYGVLRMQAQPSRFTQHMAVPIDVDDIPGAATFIAAEMDERVAECAYAAEGAFAHLGAARPALAGLPRIAIGFSGGAMTLPTVVAREPSKYAASVLVGAGCDFWLMNETSNYAAMIDAVEEKWQGGEATPGLRRELDAEYLKRASLDSYHTAAALKGKPVLLIQGTSDLAVPSPLGDVLWERLGRPDRWLRDAGHESLFAVLPGDYPAILGWIDRALGAGATKDTGERKDAGP